ncbi:hypothetical protein [Cupriavidus pampae]|uniref:Uncharacterized protein n=1 Tax=Cupriavidus pampae TaxID=659251 RepID=A0ABM8WR18_9BURK|nr:hypothetical protein [Cupriavidus pampae]CAG9169894.1 hypothetical protein LMG32289_01902 [Cupriavidus pampae]
MLVAFGIWKRISRHVAPRFVAQRFVAQHLPRVALAALLVPAASVALAQQATIMTDTPTITGGPANNPSGAGAPVRAIPDDAGQARLTMAAPNASGPQSAKLGSKTVTMAPGLRVFNTDMQLTPVANLVGQKLEVRYRLDVYGQLLTAWIMTEVEYKAWKAAH